MMSDPVGKLFRLIPACLFMSGTALSFAAGSQGSFDIVTVLDAGGIRETGVSLAVEGTNSVTVDTKDLEPGIYMLHIYARDNGGAESTSVTRLVYVAERATVAGAEYFIDADPGAGNGHVLDPGSGGAISFSVPTSNLESGLHTLSVRARDAAFNWGDVVSRNFLVIRNSAGIEWFYDRDPGIGLGNQAEPDESGVVMLPTTDLTAGVHTLSVRTRDAAGNWSPTVTHLLYVTEHHELTACEYFIDTDPGEGAGITLPLAADGEASFAIPTSGLSAGIHHLHIRGKDKADKWHMVFAAPFRVTVGSGVENVSWLMDVSVSRGSGSVLLSADNLEPDSHVEIITVDGMVVYSGMWRDTDSPLEISLDQSHRNCILTIVTPAGHRLLKRIR